MVYKVVLLTCLLFVSTFASLTPDKRLGKPNEYFLHPKDAKYGPDPRIIGGDEVIPYKYPFQVALRIYKGKNYYACGGTLYSNRFVLTAAHCLDVCPDYIIVILGAHDISNPYSIGLILNTTTYVLHEDWNKFTLQNDVALVQLPRGITFTNRIKPVKIARGDNAYAGLKGITLGWGQTEYVKYPSYLRGVELPIMSNAECTSFDGFYKLTIKSMHLCTSGKGIVGTCVGDSGGPLLVDGTQVGIVSFGPKDCTLGEPSVFTRVTEYHDWIVEHAVAGASTLNGIQFVAMAVVALCLVRFFK